MTDIVERLRDWPTYSPGGRGLAHGCREAADEIERLRKELDSVRERCASIARRMNAPSVAGAISGDGK